MNFQVTILKVLASYSDGFASLADIKRDVAILATSGREWSDRTTRLAARAPGLEIFAENLVERREGGWRITDAGRSALELMEKPAAPEVPLAQVVPPEPSPAIPHLGKPCRYRTGSAPHGATAASPEGEQTTADGKRVLDGAVTTWRSPARDLQTNRDWRAWRGQRMKKMLLPSILACVPRVRVGLLTDLRRNLPVAAGMVGLILSPAVAADANHGAELAKRWCASCHVVEGGQKQASADVPPFAAIANKSDFSAEKLAFFLLDPHPKMPNFPLSRNEAGDIAAYIGSLRK